MDSNQFTNAQYVQPAPEPQKKGFGKGTFLIIGLTIGVVFTCLLFAVVMTMNSKKAPAKIEGAGYDSPEEAVEAYLNFLKEGDLDGAVSTFAVESCVDNYDIEEHLEWVQYFGATMPLGGRQTPTLIYDSDFSRELNIESRRSYILNGICGQMMSITVMSTDEEDVVDGLVSRAMYELEDKDAAENVVNFLAIDPKLETIEIGDRLDEDDFFDSDFDLNKYMKRYKKIWGSDIEMVTLEMEIDNEDYTLFMICVCYDGKWYVADFNNPLGLSLGTSTICKGLVPDDYLDK